MSNTSISQLLFDEASCLKRLPLPARFENERDEITQRLERLAAELMEQEQAGSPD